MTRAIFAVLFSVFAAAIVAAPAVRADVALERPAPFRLGMQLERTPAGARVVAVAPNGAAKLMGLRRGDLILAVNALYVGSFTADRLRNLGSGEQYTQLTLLVVRNNTQVIELRAPSRR